MRFILLANLLAGLVFASGGSCLAGGKEAAAYSSSRGEISLLVWERGHITQERYSRDAGPNYPENIYSITKSLSALGVLAAVGQGKLKLDQPLSEIIPAWRKDGRARITLRELLSQTSGLDPGYSVLYGGKLLDKRAKALGLRLESTPGSVFRYGPVNYEAIEALVGQRIAPDTQAWLQRTLLTPLGVQIRDWRKDGKGAPYFSAGAFLTTRDLLAVGQLVRQRGWQWIFPLVPSRLMAEAVTGSNANPMYGLGFWLNRNATRPALERDVEEAIGAGLSANQWRTSCLSKAAPADLIAMVGSRGQRVYIVPSRQLIIVRLGRSTGFRDPDFLRAFFR